MKKIVLVGAGGVNFSQKFIKDLLLDERLREEYEICLMDIDRGRLDMAVKAACLTAEKLKIKFRYSATTDLRTAVRGAAFVLTVFRCGELRHQELEYEIPLKYGVDQVVSDTLGPGGVFRGLRTLKPLFEVLDMMEEEAPGAYLLNYVNPMSINTIALSRRAKTVKVIGLCHSVQHTANTICKYIGIDRKKLRFRCAGVNHQAFYLKLEADGQDLYPELFKCLDRPEIYKKDKVRFEIMRYFGFFPTESSGHGSEYVQYFRKRQDLIDRYCSHDIPQLWEDGFDGGIMNDGVSGASLKVCRYLQSTWERRIEEIVSGKQKISAEPSNEYGMQIIHAITCDEPMEANLNIINRGLIPTLPPEASVEVPCLVNGGGIQPCRVEDYPEQLAGLNRQMINVQLLAAQGVLECDRTAVFRAVALDPNTSSKLGLEEIRKMTDELFGALRSEIDPRFFHA